MTTIARIKMPIKASQVGYGTHEVTEITLDLTGFSGLVKNSFTTRIPFMFVYFHL